MSPKHNKYAEHSKARKVQRTRQSIVTCTRKVPYGSNSKALAAAERIEEKTGRALRPYFCALCQKYHLTTRKPEA